MKLVDLHPELDCENIGRALRNIADDIEAGKYVFDPTMAIVVLGHERIRKDGDGSVHSFDWQTHGLGKCGVFAGKGLLAAALSSFDGSA